MKNTIFLLIATLALSSCHRQDQRDFKVSIDNTLFQPAQAITEITDPGLEEVSGIVVSRDQTGYFWVHNDSGDSATLYMIDLQGRLIMTALLEGIEAIDWEDIALVECDGTDLLIIGDIGDNGAERDHVSVHIVEEPKYTGEPAMVIPAQLIKTYTIQYEEGPRDSESINYHPVSRQVSIITKREKNVMLYSFDLDDSRQKVLSSLGEIALRNFTSADINDKGELLIKNYKSIFFWEADSQINVIISKTPVRIPYLPEPQGEAIGWDGLGGFYTLSELNEDAKQILYYYAPKQGNGSQKE